MKALLVIAAFYAFCVLLGIVAWLRHIERRSTPHHRPLHLDRDSDWE